MNYGIVNERQLEEIDDSLERELIQSGVQCVILVDTAGNLITKASHPGFQYDIYAFSALAAGNFAAVDSIARLVGLNEFSLVYSKGKKVSVHFRKVGQDLILVSIFGNAVSLGVLRAKITEVVRRIGRICHFQQVPDDDGLAVFEGAA